MEQHCRITGEPLEEVIDLGDLFISNFLPTIDETAPHGRLRLGISPKSGLLQLMDNFERGPLYRHYWYRSGTNETMKRQLSDILDTATHWIRLRDGDIVLDTGCNDGTLLSFYPRVCKVERIGIDPAENLEEEAKKHCEKHHTGFFNKEVFRSLAGNRNARVITSIAMFYGLGDPVSFVEDVRECLADDGIWILQLSYTPLMLKQNAFDNICHEHLEYYTLQSLTYLLELCGLKIVDVEFNETNAGSFRVVAMHKTAHPREAPVFVRDIGTFRTESTLEFEKRHAFDEPSTYRDYMARLLLLKAETLALLERIASEGKTVWGYGASTKGNTLLQFYGLSPSLIGKIAERQPQKWGLLTAGSWIPIASEEEMRSEKPDYLLVLPWHFIEEFYRRENAFIEGGGKFIVPLPELQLHPAGDR